MFLSAHMPGSHRVHGDPITFGSGGVPARKLHPLSEVHRDSRAIKDTTCSLHITLLQVLDLDGLLRFYSPTYPRLAPTYFAVSNLHFSSRICRPRDRSFPSRPADYREPTRPVVQGIPTLRAGSVAHR